MSWIAVPRYHPSDNNVADIHHSCRLIFKTLDNEGWLEFSFLVIYPFQRPSGKRGSVVDSGD